MSRHEDDLVDALTLSPPLSVADDSLRGVVWRAVTHRCGTDNFVVASSRRVSKWMCWGDVVTNSHKTAPRQPLLRCAPPPSPLSCPPPWGLPVGVEPACCTPACAGAWALSWVWKLWAVPILSTSLTFDTRRGTQLARRAHYLALGPAAAAAAWGPPVARPG